MVYTEGENAEKQKEGKDKNKGNSGVRQVNRKTCLPYVFSSLMASERRKSGQRVLSDVRNGRNRWGFSYFCNKL